MLYRNDGGVGELSGARATVGPATPIADGGDCGAGLVIPHRRARGQSELPAWKKEHDRSHREATAGKRPSTQTPAMPAD
ncbi:hypothetical protein DN051_01690 [Streptomyces cadmiisoli]|uniref:Uncharacterized protein n=1 Tax=Streptomyces cadmiisoli TaxID=2184053 RepID=A0A2Z4IQU7_9ACTN|nr:hypothetical protein DN051_01690 [Streptomyces cadmiisoli]